MKVLGILLTVIGIIWAIAAFNMDTTVYTGGESLGSAVFSTTRVHNLGLIERRRGHLIFASLTIVVGVMLFGFSTLSENRARTTRTCPFCAEGIQPAAKVCPHCQRELPREDDRASSDQTVSIEQVGRQPPPSIFASPWGLLFLVLASILALFLVVVNQHLTLDSGGRSESKKTEELSTSREISFSNSPSKVTLLPESVSMTKTEILEQIQLNERLGNTRTASIWKESLALGQSDSTPESGVPLDAVAKMNTPSTIIKTKFGDMEIRFFPDKAAKHVENFITLAKSGFYNGTLFHRVIPGFMIQGGDPNTKDPNRKSEYGMGGPPGVRLKAEFNDIPHKRGIVSMARSNNPDSAGSQFFIVVKDSPFLDHQYTVFGEVTKGMEVADKIVNAPRGANDLPTERIEMTVEVLVGRQDYISSLKSTAGEIGIQPKGPNKRKPPPQRQLEGDTMEPCPPFTGRCD